MKLARIPSSEAKDTIPQLLRMDLVDRHAKISKDGITAWSRYWIRPWTG